MGQSEIQTADDPRSRLIDTARAMVLRGESKFSINTLCSEAGVERTQFRAHFSGKTALMAAVMQGQVSQPVPVVQLPAPQPAPEPQTPKVEQETAVSAPDAWLERRLRVFERALSTLEAKSEAAARDQARVIAQLEERLASLGNDMPEQRPALRPVVAERVEPATRSEIVPNGAVASNAAPVEMPGNASEAEAPQPSEEKKPGGEVLALEPLPLTTLSRQAMADVLASARDKARAAAATEKEKGPQASN